MRLAREFVLDAGGLERARVFTKLWFSLFGLWSWRDVPVIPPKLIFLPPWAPLSIYNFAGWARQTVAALTVVSAYRPVRPIPITLDELRRGGPPQTRYPITDPLGLAFLRVDRLLHVYERRPLSALRRSALRPVERWIVERQEADGSWAGSSPLGVLADGTSCARIPARAPGDAAGPRGTRRLHHHRRRQHSTPTTVAG